LDLLAVVVGATGRRRRDRQCRALSLASDSQSEFDRSPELRLLLERGLVKVPVEHLQEMSLGGEGLASLGRLEPVGGVLQVLEKIVGGVALQITGRISDQELVHPGPRRAGMVHSRR
jgi:hypothetical protein